jgi:uncharacterized protein (TIGR02246 family)
MSIFRSGLGLLWLLVSSHPLPGQTVDASAARRSIEAGNAAYVAAFARADPAGVAAVYDLQGARLNEGGVVVRGRDAITRDVRQFVERVGPVKVGLQTAAVWVVDDRAYESGAWSYRFTPPGKAEQTLGGRYVTVWKRQRGGDWKIAADMGVPGT